MRFILTYFFIIILSGNLCSQNVQFIPGEVIVKIKTTKASKCAKNYISIPSIQKIVQLESISKTTKIFPNHSPVKTKKAKDDRVDLSTLYRFQFDPKVDPQKILNQLKKDQNVQYAELNYVNYLTYDPSDTLNGKQWYLSAINAFQAWDIQKGDTNVVIAFTDTGTDTDHPDLVDNYAYNYADPINGIDDDNDGYVDNYLGWDVADNDNDVQLFNSGHGVNVGGLASATTDNVTGISSAGFNTRILPVKIDQNSTGQLTAAYQGIVYAADHGAFIITNSWGSHVYSQFAQDIINYAALNKKCLVIAATGNNGDDRRFYPAAYENVLSVGSMQFNDTVKANSNYGYWVDIFAPGESMLTTNAIGGYGTNGGTSMAAPVLAGVAGLLKAQFPRYGREEITEQLLNNGKNIYAVNDAKYTNKLGAGQLDAFKSLTDSVSPGIIFKNRSITDGNDDLFAINDTLKIGGIFKNVLKDASNVSVTLSTINNRLQIINGTINFGNLNSGDSVDISSNPFLVRIPPSVDFNETIEFQLNITATNYSKKQFFHEIVNVDYLTVNENNLTLTLTSNGSIGYGGFNGSLGEGIKHLGGNSHLYEGSFMIGNSSDYVADKFRGDASGVNDDFMIKIPVNKLTPRLADFEASSVFDDSKLSPNPNFEIEQKWYIYKNSDADNSIIYEYTVENVSGIVQNNIYAGMIADWDIADYSMNKVIYDAGRRMGISFSTDTAIYIGIKVLNDSLSNNHYAIDNAYAGRSGVNLSDGFSTQEKFQVLSNNRKIAGDSTLEGNDIIDASSVGPFSLRAGEKVQLAFSITVSSSLNSLKTESDTVQNLFNRYISKDSPFFYEFTEAELLVYPNPVKDRLTASVTLLQEGTFSVEVINMAGKRVYLKERLDFQKDNNLFQLNTEDWKSGIYFLKIKGNNLLFQNKFVVAQ